MFEINVILQWAKMWRVYVLMTAILYNLVYAGVMIEWIWHIAVAGWGWFDQEEEEGKKRNETEIK